MSLRDPHLAFTAVLAPVERFAVRPPPWPGVVTDLFGDPQVPDVDPVAAVLYGPLARRRIAVTSGSGGSVAVLFGLGDAVAVSVIESAPGDVDTVPKQALRERAAQGLLRGFPDDDPAEPPPEDQAERLRERLGSDPRWELLGLVEVLTVLVEGSPTDLPVGGFWADHGPIRLGRAVGVGEGHAAWEVQSHFTRESEREVGEQRLRALRDGHLTKVPAIVDYACGALRWGRAARRALGQAAALDALIDEVRAATSWAVAGGPAPGGKTPDLLRLVARLETLRVGMVEEIETLRGLRPRMADSVGRIFGEGSAPRGGPFAEGGPDGERLLTALAAREASAGRWSATLEVARRAREG